MPPGMFVYMPIDVRRYFIQAIYESSFGSSFLVGGIEGIKFVGNIDQYHIRRLDDKEKQAHNAPREILKHKIRKNINKSMPKRLVARDGTRPLV